MEKGDYQGALSLLDQALTRISEADGVSRAIIPSNRGFVLAGLCRGNIASLESMRNRDSMKGLELCERYFRQIALPVFEQTCGALLGRMAIGLVGDGSECFGYDDEISPGP